MIRNEKGFTLIELMVVVLIIGILVAVAIPTFSSAANNARNKACDANLRTMDGAIAQYEAEWSTVPTLISQLVGAGFLMEAPSDPHPAPDNGAYQITSGRAASGNGHNDTY